jgi:2-beta-glucuronyltransferase
MPIYARAPFLVISGHDFRSTRRTTIHFITRELERLGTVRFFSVGYSPLSMLKRDPRNDLWSHSNIIERYNGVECYLWRSLVHPFNVHNACLAPLEKIAFKLYARTAPGVLRDWIVESNTILLESGMSILFVQLIKKLHPKAKLIYICSDQLKTIGCSHFLQQELFRVSPLFDVRRVAAAELASEFPTGSEIVYIPQGMDAVSLDCMEPSPYEGGVNLLSVGSMLFEPQFFEMATASFPQFNFHIIGGGAKAASLSANNLRNYGEMPPEKIFAHLRHADVGIAPYAGDKVAPYLAESSMKLFQFQAHGLPAVCPQSVVGRHSGRFGYTPGNLASIKSAIGAALACGRFAGQAPYSWAEVARRVLNPHEYPDIQTQH